MVLIKTCITKNYNKFDILHNDIKKWLEKRPTFEGLIIRNNFGNIYSNNQTFIPHEFNGEIVFISAKSFIQNNYKLGKFIRKYVSQFLYDISSVVCFGGESYLYALTNNNVKHVCHYTNSNSIFRDFIYNIKVKMKHFSNVDNNLINYNKLFFVPNYECCILNLSKLNIHVIEEINKISFNKIIIINCHHDDFWNKTKRLTNYKLTCRKKFICNDLKYFITVNVFYRKNLFISLGANCSVAYNLNKCGMRTKAYPFDWSNVKINQLIHVLQTNFFDYNCVEIKKLSAVHPNFKTKALESYIVKNNYGITFAHELSNVNELIEFKTKLIRRINRFRNLNNPIFVRLEMGKVNIELYNTLYSLLSLYFEKFKLVVITKDKLYHSNIIFIQNKCEFIDWKYSNFNWRQLFYL